MRVSLPSSPGTPPLDPVSGPGPVKLPRETEPLAEGAGFDPPTEGVGTEPSIRPAARGLS